MGNSERGERRLALSAPAAWPDRRFDLFDHYENDHDLIALVAAGVGSVLVVDRSASRVVVGFGLIHAYEQGALPPDSLVTIVDAPPSCAEQLMLAVRAVRQWRTLSLGEQLRVLEAADAGRDAARAQLLGGVERVVIAERTRALGDPWRAAVIAERVDLKTAERARHLPAAIAQRLLRAIDPLSASRRRIAVGMFEEVVRRDALSPAQQKDLLADDAPDHSAPDHPAAETFFEQLSAARYPQRTRMVAGLRRFEARHLKGRGVQLVVPDNFEGDSIGVTFRWNSRAQFRKRLETLGAIEDHVDELLGLLF